MSLSAVAVLDLVTGEAGDRGAVAPHLPQVGRTVLSLCGERLGFWANEGGFLTEIQAR